MKTKLLFLLLLVSFSIYAQQYTSIPDVNFENKLISLGIDSGTPDGQVLTSKVASLTSLYVENSSIINLTGIEAFTALKDLRCSSNRLTQLNLSKNIALTSLECSNNLLTTLDIFNNPLLLKLDCSQNKITALDFSNNTALKTIYCSSNQITTLNVSKQLMLERFYCDTNKIETLDLSPNVNLSALTCHTNLLKNLDLSKNTKLYFVQAHNNSFISFNIQNGTNYLFNAPLSTLTFNSPNLKCVQVDNVEEANVRWASVKGDAQYSTFCSPYTTIPDVNFEKKLIALGIDKDGENGKVLTADITSVTSLNVSNSSITDLTGIQDFHSLTNLSCDGNQLSRLDVTKNIYLAALSCNQNKITALNVSRNTALKTLSCSSNQLTSIDLSYNSSLQIFDISQNKIERFEVNHNGALTSLRLDENLITSLDLLNNRALTSLSVDANRLTTLNLTNNTLLTTAVSFKSNPELYCIQVSSLTYANANWSDKKDKTTSFSSTPCLLSEYFTLIPDINFENKLISLGIDSGTADGKILTSKAASVTSLNVSQSSITNLTGIEAFVALKTLNCANNRLTQLNVSKSTLLTSLECNNNQLNALDVTNNPLLLVLELSNNNVFGINFSNNTALKSIRCYNNFISNINVTQQLALESLDFGFNRVQNIDLSLNVNLQSLICNNNWLQTLDISKNNKLTNMLAYVNELSRLNIKNGANNLFYNPGSAIRFDYNPYLTCIQVDNVEEANARWSNQKTPEAGFSTDCSVYTLIPDLEFEKKLIALGIDSGEIDGRVLTSKIQTVKSLTVDTRVISDLTGIQDFTALETLSATGSAYYYLTAEADGLLKTLDVSKNTNLISLNCSKNKLTSLDVSNNKKLITLNFSENKIAAINITNNPDLETLSLNNTLIDTIDISKHLALTTFTCSGTKVTSFNVSKNTGLRILNVSNNKLTTLDVSNNTNLNSLYCESNLLASIDISKNINLTIFNCFINPLTTLNLSNNILLDRIDFSDTEIADIDLTKNINLTSISCGTKKLTSIDVSKNLKLSYFNCNSGQLKTLDLSKNTNLTSVFCQYNTTLSEINLKNGNNTKITSSNLNLTGNPNLYCVLVDNVNYSTQNWTKKDVYFNYTATACSAPSYTLIPDKEFEKRLIELGIDSGEPDGKVLTPRIGAVKSLKVDPTLVADLTGIEDFTALESLECRNNCIVTTGGGCGKITKLDVSKNTALTQLYCEGNQLTSLDISKNSKLVSLYCSSNKLTSIDISNNPDLSSLDVSRNFLTELNLSNNKKLYQVSCRSNKLKNLDVTNSKLTLLACSDNELSSLDLSNQNNLVQLYVENNKLTGLDTTNKPNLLYFNCSGNLLTNVNVTSSTNLLDLNCSNNKLTSLNVTQNSNLTILSCGTNTIPGFDLSKNLKLKELDCTSLQLNELDVTFLPELKKLTASKNNLSTINLSKNLKLTHVYLPQNQITEIDITKNILLTDLLISNNKLTVLNPVNNLELEYVDFYNNQLTTFDISKNKKVHYVNCNNNKLTSLNLQNGIKEFYINIDVPNYKNNPNLKCIQVTDAKYAKTNWSYYADPNVRFSEDCAGPLTLPANNFTVETKAETCLGENNGQINITAKEAYAYQAKINGKTLDFTNNTLNYSNLTPGNYTVSISIPNEFFEQNFNVTINKGASATGKSTITSKNVQVEIIQGTAPFTVYVDGSEQFQTTDTNFNVNLEKGGLIEVATAKACEGTFSKKVSILEVGGVLAAYPNPTSGKFEIEIPTSKNEVKIELYNFAGQLVSAKTYILENGKTVVNLENLLSGIYAAKIYLETPEYLKIIKL